MLIDIVLYFFIADVKDEVEIALKEEKRDEALRQEEEEKA